MIKQTFHAFTHKPNKNFVYFFYEIRIRMVFSFKFQSCLYSKSVFCLFFSLYFSVLIHVPFIVLSSVRCQHFYSQREHMVDSTESLLGHSHLLVTSDSKRDRASSAIRGGAGSVWRKLWRFGGSLSHCPHTVLLGSA